MPKNQLTKVRKIGESYGFIIPIQYLREQGMKRGDELLVTLVEDDALLVRKINIIT